MRGPAPGPVVRARRQAGPAPGPVVRARRQAGPAPVREVSPERMWRGPERRREVRVRAAVARAGQRAALPPAVVRERPRREARQQAQRGLRCRGPARRSPARGPATRSGRSRSGSDPGEGRSAPVRRAPRRARPPKSRSFRPGSGRSDVSAWESLSAGMALDERVSPQAVSRGGNAPARAPRRGPLRSYPPRRLRPRGARRTLLPRDPRTAPGHRRKAPDVARDVGLGGRAFAVSPALPPVAAARVVLLCGRRELRLRLGLWLRFGHRPPGLRRLCDEVVCA